MNEAHEVFNLQGGAKTRCRWGNNPINMGAATRGARDRNLLLNSACDRVSKLKPERRSKPQESARLRPLELSAFEFCTGSHLINLSNLLT